MQEGSYPTAAFSSQATMNNSCHRSTTDALDAIFEAVTRERWSMRCVCVRMDQSFPDVDSTACSCLLAWTWCVHRVSRFLSIWC